jgi:ribose-phosphate pyrophosphokinase
MDSPMAFVDKRRVEMDVTEVMHLVGEVRGRTCLILDDIIDTAGTLVKTGVALMENGAEAVYACASHPVLSGPAIERISKSPITEVVITNTIPLTEEGKREPKIKVLSIAGLIARAIQSIHEETSVSRLFA